MISKAEEPVRLTADYTRPSGFAAGGDTIPFQVDGTYHLFQLASPANTTHHPKRVRCNWVRQKSKNLISWTRDAAPVIPPGDGEDAHDRDGSWTGSAVIGPDGNMHIFYTGYNLPKGGVQVILHAKSSDREGTKFEKPQAPIAIDSSSSLDRFESTDFRDPYVFFNEQEGLYWMVVATRLSEGPYWTRGCLALLVSADLETWTVEPEPLYSPNNIFCPECPELFTLGNGRWYLAYSRFSAPAAGTHYMIADCPRGPFRSPRDSSGGRFDGRRWYAAKSCARAGDPGRRIGFAWVHDFNESDGKWLWGGSTMRPREIMAAADGSLLMKPCPEILAALSPVAEGDVPAEVRLGAPAITATTTLPVGRPPRGTLRCLTFSVREPDAKSFGVLLEFDDDMRGFRVAFEHVTAGVYSVALLTDLPPLDDFWADLTRHSIEKLVDGPELVRHGAVRLDEPVRVMLSEDIVEVFVGGKVMTQRLPPRASKNPVQGPDAPAPAKVHPVGLFVEDGEVVFADMSLTQVEEE